MHHVGHWRSALGSRHQQRSDFCARFFIVGAEHCATWTAWRRGRLGIAHHDERSRDHQPDTRRARLTGLRNVQAFKSRVVSDVIRRVAVRHLPDNLATIKIDRSESAVRRLHHRQSLDAEGDPGRRWRRGRFRRRLRWGTRRIGGAAVARTHDFRERPSSDALDITDIGESRRRCHERSRRARRLPPDPRGRLSAVRDTVAHRTERRRDRHAGAARRSRTPADGACRAHRRSLGSERIPAVSARPSVSTGSGRAAGPRTEKIPRIRRRLRRVWLCGRRLLAGDV